MEDWNSEQYLIFKKERTQPAADLAGRIEVDHPKRVIDIGCGPGNSTEILKKRFPNADITGADFSQNMISRAENDYPDIDFMLFDASKDFEKLVHKYDVVFSNACIQWVPDHKRLLQNMMNILNPNGIMAAQVPMNFEEPIHRLIAEVSSRKEWKDKFCNPRSFYTLTENEYFDLLSEISLDFTMWKTVYFHRMPTHQSIVEWYKSTGMKPYLDALNEGDKFRFEQDVLREVKKEYRVQKNGEILFRFPRLFFTAVK